MSLVEIAGLLVGAPPLIFHILDTYKRALKPLRRYQKFDQFLGELTLRINTCRIASDNVMEILLAAVFSKEEASKMMSDAAHARWHSDEAEILVKDYLGSNYETVVAMMKEISDIIAPLVEQLLKHCKPAKEVKQGDEPKKDKSKRHAAKRIKDKIVLSFQEGHIENEVGRASTQTETLRSLVIHPKEVEEADRIFKERQSKKSHADSQMKTFKIVQQSSKALFETVQSSCTIHEIHHAHLGLNPIVQDISVAQISFDLLFGRLDTSTNLASWSPGFRLLVQSSLRSQRFSVIRNRIEDSLLPVASCSVSTILPVDAAKAFASASTALRPEPNPKRVKFEDDAPDHADFELDENAQSTDFMLRSNFCIWLRNYTISQPKGADECIGCVDRNSRCQLRFHLKTALPSQIGGTGISLENLLLHIRKMSSIGGLPYYQKLRLAHILASAVMNFHDTPWMASDKFCSTNILFSDVSLIEDLLDHSLPDPFINVPISSAKQIEQVQKKSHMFIRNELVFRLGITLVELALEEPFQTLQLASEKCTGGIEGEKATAERLLPCVRRRLGRRYEAVVRKCLRLYASEEPLGRCEEAMQRSYHQEVINELRELENRIRALDISEEFVPVEGFG